jgi:hypothetical protein
MVGFGAEGPVEAAVALSITSVALAVTWFVVARRMLAGAGSPGEVHEIGSAPGRDEGSRGAPT